MQFFINGTPCLDPVTMSSEARLHGFSTSNWEGKANCWIDQRGPYPSYGYFLVPGTVIPSLKSYDGSSADNENIPGGADTIPQGAYKVSLTIQLDEHDGEGLVMNRQLDDLYVSSWINITPGWTDKACIHLVKIVDARFIFEGLGSTWSNKYTDMWFNKVEGFLTPEELKVEFDLNEIPDKGSFVYAKYSIDSDKAPDKYGLPIPFTWEELFREFFSQFTETHVGNSFVSFPWFEKEYEFKLDMEDIEFPEYVPQDLFTHGKTPAEFLEQMLFWTGTSLLYNGHGNVQIINVKNSPNAENNFNSLIENFKQRKELELFTETTSVSEDVPGIVEFAYPIMADERENNEEAEYEFGTTPIFWNPGNGQWTRRVSWKFPTITLPFVWFSKRILPIDNGILPNEELEALITDDFVTRLEFILDLLPTRTLNIIGGFDIGPGEYVARVSFFDIGSGPKMKIESALPINWELFSPQRIIPRELKLSIIVAKVAGYYDEEDPGELIEGGITGDRKTFAFKDAKLILGDFPAEGEGIAYNTFNQSYGADEEIVLFRGQRDEWRSNSQVADFDGYYIIDRGNFLVVKGLVSDLNVQTDFSTIQLDKLTLVNGMIPFSTDDTQVLRIKNDPNLLFDEGSQEVFYARFDSSVDPSKYNGWSFHDPGNFRPTIKGLGGYSSGAQSNDPEIIVHPDIDGNGNKLRWEKLGNAIGALQTSSDLGSHVLTLIGEAARWVDSDTVGGGGTGGPGSGTGPPGSSQVTICKALVNEPTGVSNTDIVLDFDNAVSIIGTAPVNGEGFAQNTFNLPFSDNEPILLIQRNDASWTAFKSTINICTGQVAAPSDVLSSTAEFDFDTVVSLYGIAPTGTSRKAVNPLSLEFADNDKLLLIQRTDGKFFPISLEPQAGMFRTISQVTAASWNNAQGRLSLGQGNARKMIPLANNQFEVVTTSAYVLRNMVPTIIAANRNVQAKRIGRYWIIDVEDCSG